MDLKRLATARQPTRLRPEHFSGSEYCPEHLWATIPVCTHAQMRIKWLCDRSSKQSADKLESCAWLKGMRGRSNEGRKIWEAAKNGVGAAKKTEIFLMRGLRPIENERYTLWQFAIT